MTDDSIWSEITDQDKDLNDLSRDEIETIIEENSKIIEKIDEQIERITAAKSALETKRKELEHYLMNEGHAPNETNKLEEIFSNFSESLEELSRNDD